MSSDLIVMAGYARTPMGGFQGAFASEKATTVNKMCGSGMQAAIMAAEVLQSGAVDIAIAGGMESMSNAPYALPKHRAGARIGHDRGVASLCIGGDEATAMALELV